jgi:hypothetical protein
MRRRKRWAVVALLGVALVVAAGAQSAVAGTGVKAPKLTLVGSTVTLQPNGWYEVQATLKWTKVPQAETYSLWEFFPGQGAIGSVGLSNKTHKDSTDAFTLLQPGQSLAVKYLVTTCSEITLPLTCPVQSNPVYVQVP